ncbi:MAG TPA: sulfotransferase [Rhodospirillaceae bacterium]|nr:sulfotransferase [Rhodospirillaceae bacterium]
MAGFDFFISKIRKLHRTQLFFVYGSMRSGTTWLQLMLDAHPAVSCRGEAHFLDRLVPSLQEAASRHNAYLEWKNRSIFEEIGGYPTFSVDHLRHLAVTAMLLLMAEQSKDKACVAVGEKTPDSIRFLPLLKILFPKAKFIHIVRDGRDSTVSAWFHNQRTSPEWLQQNYSSLDAFAAASADEWGKEMSLATEFATSHPASCFTLRYEDLLERPEALLKDILRFLGVKATAAQISACCAGTSFINLTNGRQSGQEDRGSFFRKGTSGDWLNHFTPAMNDVFRDKAGRWLEHFGYEMPKATQPGRRSSSQPSPDFFSA